MELPTPSREEWQHLYEAAIAVKQLAPWEWMYEDDIFGVQNPETGQIGYGSVMGTAGEHLALALYLGSEGLAGLWRMYHADPQTDAFLILEIPHLQASFEDRAELDARDRRVIKDLGLRFRGRQAWPQFRSYVPACAPWYLTPEEARFLAMALEQTLVVARRVHDDPDLLEPSDDEGDEYLVRVQGEEGWTDQWLVPEPEEQLPIPKVDPQRLAAIDDSLPRQKFVLEADLFPMPQYVKEKEDPRPLLAYHIIVVEASTGFIVAGDLLLAKPSFPTMFAGAQVCVLNAIERMEGIPQLIAVRDERLAEILLPIAAGLDIDLVVSATLPALDPARAELEQWAR
jgi:hypothetical protein